MACFLIPTAEAIVTTAATKIAASKEIEETSAVHEKSSSKTTERRHSFIRKLKWLNYMLWGGAALLAFEHIWHGEVTPWFPFLTAAENSADRAVMLQEMSTAGVCMALMITVIWIGMVILSTVIEKRELKAEATIS